MNGTMIQYFHWYTPADGTWWKHVAENAKNLSKLGITAVWLPPAHKAAAGALSVGYDVYDLYDLGEFDQKQTIRTRYGTKDEYISAIKALKKEKIQVIADIVLNHKGGADETEKITVVKVNPENRLEVLSEPFEIEAYTKFTFPGRNKKYSDFIWDFMCFTGVDYDKGNNETGIYSIIHEWGDDWEEVIDEEKGNYDYLMFNDVEFRNPAVREELVKWGKWYIDTVGFEGVRLDAVKHISPKFFNEWLSQLREITGKEIFAVGEYWAPGYLHLLLKYIEATEGKMSLFDSSLHNNFHRAGKEKRNFNLTTIFDNTLVQAMPDKAVTVVDNHDTQPLQALEAPVESWFKSIAYALTLLRQQGYPCVFYPDLYGASYKDKGRDGNEYEIILPKIDELEKLLLARKLFAFGDQKDYLDHPNCIGFTRQGDDNHSGCAVLISNGDDGFKKMEIGKKYAGKKFTDYLGKHTAEVIIDKDGCAEFFVNAESVSVWIQST